MSYIPNNKKPGTPSKPKAGGVAMCNVDVAFGLFGLKALEPFLITGKQIEAIRKILSRACKKNGRIWIRCFPNLAVTRRPSDVRMGGGKGSIAFWVFKVRAGTIMFEVDGISEDEARDVFARALLKLPITGKLVKRKFTYVE
jgi:large subunit ribosomal protein L16